jgi:hypothetical protein
MKFRLLYPHNLEHPGFDLEPIAALQSEDTVVFLVKNHRIGGQLDLYGIADFPKEDFWGWYPVFTLASGIMKSMINAPIGKTYRIQNKFDHEVKQWKMVEFKIIDLKSTLEYLAKTHDVNLHVLKDINGIKVNYGHSRF